MTAPQQFSPDGQWWWDGTQWVPASQAPTPPPGGGPVPQQPQAETGPGAYPTAPTYPTAPQPYGAYSQGPVYGGPPPAKAGSDGKAIASLVLAILWLCGLGSIVAVILGHSSRGSARKRGLQPSGLAMAGIVLGYLGILGTVLTTVGFFAFRSTIDTAIQLQSASDAEQSYHDEHGTYTANVNDLRLYGFTSIEHNKVKITIISATSTTFCISGKVASRTEYVDQNRRRPSTTPCS